MTPDERDEISASIAAHRELGAEYDKAVADGLVERIGEEIDKRVDARLRAAAAYPPQVTAPARHGPSGFGIVLVSLIFGTGATSVVLGGDDTADSVAKMFMVLLIWAAIAVINVVYALR